MNEAEYILRLILRARDELSSKLAKVRTELQGLEKDSAKVTKGFDDLNKRITSANTRIGNLTDKVKEARAAFRDFGSEGEKSAQRAEAAGAKIKKAGDEIETTAEKGKRLADNVKVLQDEFSHLERDLERGKRSRKDAEDGFKRIGDELQKLSRSADVGSDLMFAINRVTDQVRRAQGAISDMRRQDEADEKASQDRKERSASEHRSAMADLAREMVADVNRITEEGRRNTQSIDEQDAADKLRRTMGRIEAELAAERTAARERERMETERARIAERAGAEFRRDEQEAHKLNDRITRVHDAYRQFNAEISRGEHDASTASAGLREFRGAFDDLGRKMGSFSNLGRAFRLEADSIGTRIRDLGRDADNQSNAFERAGSNIMNLGHRFNEVGENVAALDNKFRGMALLTVIGFSQQLLTVLVGLGGALFNVAGSAAMAGAALGGALAAGAAQALPVLGILAAALLRVKAVMDAVQQAQLVQQQQAQRQAQGQRDEAGHANTIANAQDGVRDALEGVADARRRVADAVRNVGDAERREEEQVRKLREARREGKRELEDLILAEKRAELQAKGAALSQAESQAAFAEAIRSGQSFQQFQRGELDVASSALDLTEATRNRARQRTDTGRAVRGGVEGLDSVRQARQGVEDARRGVQDAVRSVADAERAVQRAERSVDRAQRNVENARLSAAKGTSDVFAGAEKLNFMLSQMSDAERELYDEAKIFADRWREVSGEFTEPIIREFAHMMHDINQMLLDPELVGAARDLATDMAGEMRRVWDELTSDETMAQFLQIARDAGRDLKPVTDIVINLGHAFVNIAEVAGQEGGPLDRLLDWAVRMSEKIEDLTDDKTALGEFFDVATDHAEAWLELGEAVVGLFAALVTGGAADEGLGMVKDSTKAIRGATEDIKDHAKETRNFFHNAREVANDFGRVVIAAGKEIGKSINPETVRPFADFIIQVVIPGIGLAVRTMGRITDLFLKIVNFIPGGPHAFELLVATLLVSRAVNGVIGLVGGLITGFGKTVGVLGRMAGLLGLSDTRLARMAANSERVAAASARTRPASLGAPGEGFYPPGGVPRTAPTGPVGRARDFLRRRPGLSLGAGLLGSVALGAAGSAAGNAIGGVAGGGVSGAAQGAALGLMFGPQGALIGAGIGGAVGLFTASQKQAEESKRKAVRDLAAELSKAAGKRDTSGIDHVESKARSLAAEARKFGDEKLAAEFDKVAGAAKKTGDQMEIWLHTQQQLGGFKDRVKADDIIDPQAVNEFADNLHRMRTMSFDSIGEIRDNIKFNTDKINEGLKTGSQSWADSMTTNFGEGIDAVKRAMSDGTISTDAGMKEIRRITRTQMTFMRDHMSELSEDGRDKLAKNFRSARIAIETQAGGWEKATGDSLKEIRRLMAAEFEAYGLDAESAMRLARNRTTKGRENVDQFGKNKGAIGGVVGNIGERGGDTVNALLGRGEMVLNWAHQKYIEPAVNWFYGHGLGDTFDRVHAYHSGARAYGDPTIRGFAKGGGIDVKGSKPGFAVFMQLFRDLFGDRLYVLSGSRPGSRVQGSGAISNHSAGNAIDISWPGVDRASESNPPERINPGGAHRMDRLHAYIGSHIPKPPRLDFLWRTTQGGNHFNHIHLGLAETVTRTITAARNYIKRLGREVGDVGATGSGGAAAEIKDVKVKGPESPFKAIAQAATDAVRAAANVRMNQVIDTLGGTVDGGTDTGAATDGAVSASGSSGAEKVFSYLRGRGFTDAQAAGMAGTMQFESGFSTTIRNPTSGATGLAQWLGERLVNLKKKANWTSLQTQLDFLWSELQGPESAAMRAIKAARTIADAVNAWLFKFERPGKGEEHLPERNKFARAIFGNFAKKYAVGGDVPGSGEYPIIAHGGEHIWTAAEVARAGGHGVMRMLRKMLGGGGQGGRGGRFAEGGDTTQQAIAAAQIVSSQSERERIRAIAMGVFAQTARLVLDWNQVMNEIKRATQATRVLGKTIANRIKGLSDRIFQIRKDGVQEDEKDELDAAKKERERLIKIREIRKGGVTRKERARLTALEAPDRSRFVQNIDQFIGTDQTTGLFDRAITANQRASQRAARGLTFATFGISGVSRALGAGQQLRRVLTDPQIAQRQEQNARAEQARLAALEQATTARLGQVQARMAALSRGGVQKGEAREYAALQGQLGKLQDQFGQIRDANAAALEAIYNAQEAYKQALIDAQQKIVDDINSAASRATNWLEVRMRYAAGNFGQIEQLEAERTAIMRQQRDQLTARLQEAANAGADDLVKNLIEQINELNVSIFEQTGKAVDRAVQFINQTASQRTGQVSAYMRLADVVQRSGTAALASGGFGGYLNSFRRDPVTGAAWREYYNRLQGNILRGQLSDLQSQMPAAIASGSQQRVNDLFYQIEDLRIAIVENTEQQHNLEVATRQATIDQINERANRRTSVNQGLSGIIDTIGQITGQPDIGRQRGLLQQQTGTLREQGTSLRSQLSSIFGVNLLGLSGNDFVDAVKRLNMEGITANFSQAQYDQFNGLIDAIIANENSVQQNTLQLKQLNSPSNVQGFASSAWRMFRAAIFTGTGGIIPGFENIPRFDVGGVMPYDGIAHLRAGERVIPVGGDGGTIINMPITSPTEVADPDYFANRIDWNLRGRGKR